MKKLLNIKLHCEHKRSNPLVNNRLLQSFCLRNDAIIIVSFLLLILTSCLKEDPLRNEFTSFKPKSIGDGITLSNPSIENVDSIELVKIYEDIYNDENLWPLKSLLVFRNGNLIAESYLKDETDITNQDLIWSCTKQFIGVLTGLALEHGYIESIDDPMAKYMPEEFEGHEDKSEITIKNFLKMQSGINYNNDGKSGQTDKLARQIPGNMVEFILEQEINETQGTVFHYNDGNPHLISAMIQKLVGKPTDEWADEVLFSKIGFSNYSWIRYKDGISFGAYGIKTTAREMAKFAMFVADSGIWNGEQIVSKQWITEMTSEQVVVDDDYSFGYYWWINKERAIYHMWGHGGQFAFIIPEKDMVVVMTSITNTQGDHQIDAFEALEYVDRIIEISN